MREARPLVQRGFLVRVREARTRRDRTNAGQPSSTVQTGDATSIPTPPIRRRHAREFLRHALVEPQTRLGRTVRYAGALDVIKALQRTFRSMEGRVALETIRLIKEVVDADNAAGAVPRPVQFVYACTHEAEDGPAKPSSEAARSSEVGIVLNGQEYVST